MKPETIAQLASFSPQNMMKNVDNVTALIRKIRLKQGGIGSPEDELVLCRIVLDLKFMTDIVESLLDGINIQSSKTDS